MLLDKLKFSKNNSKKTEKEIIEVDKDGAEINEQNQAPKILSKSAVKSKLSRILSSRKNIQTKYEKTHELIKQTLLSILTAVNHPVETEMSYEEIKNEFQNLDEKESENINKEDIIILLQKLIELSYAPYKYSNNPKKLNKEKKEQLQYISEAFRNIL